MPFHLVTHGVAWLHGVESSPRRLSAGDLVVFPHDTKHTLSDSETLPLLSNINQGPPDQPYEPLTGLMCGYFAFETAVAEPLLAGLPETIVMKVGAGDLHSTHTLIQLWMNEAATTQPGSDAAIDALAHVVFVHILREQLKLGHITGPLEALADPRLGQVIQQIHENPGGDHNLDALARTSGMSRSALASKFKTVVGMPPGKYVRHWRLHGARQLLRETERAVADIAEAMGFESEVAFRKSFRAFMGEPPGQVRKQFKAEKTRA